MKVLLVTHFAPPERNEGTENYTIGIANALSARGHSVHVLCATGWNTGDAYWNGVTDDENSDEDSDVHIHRVHLNWTKAWNPNQILYYSAPVEAWFERFLTQLKPDIVHVTSTYTLGTGILQVAAKQGVRLVLTLMDFWFLCPKTVLLRTGGDLCNGRTTSDECQRCLLSESNLYCRTRGILPSSLENFVWREAGRLPYLASMRGVRGKSLDMAHRKRIMRDALKLPDIILSHSRTVQDIFAQAGVESPIRYQPNGHDLAWADTYCGKSESEVIRFGYMGQIAATKGVHLLVQAFQNLPPNCGAHLDIWGDLTKDETYVTKLKTIAGSNEAISFHGRFERTNLGKVLSAIDVLVVPSVWYENAPLVIHEAFATQTPVIATNIGGMAESVSHEQNGLLFARNDVVDLSHQLNRIISEPTLLAKIREGIPKVKTVDNEIDELEQLYRELIDGKP